MRAALYARFSSEELQTSKSTDDQLHLCRRDAAGLGADVVGEYTDEGISGFSMANRPGLQRLLADAKAGRFDVVVVEDLDRLSRSDIDTLTLFDDLKALGVAIHTHADRKVERIHASLKGMVNGLFLEQLGAKVRRGHEGVIRSHRIVGRLPYGYRAVVRHDAAGERIRGLAEVDPAKAQVVRRIHADYAAGLSPEMIAQALTAEGVPAPGGGAWNGVRLRGNGVSHGILHHEIYRGVIVYGAAKDVKDRRTARSRRLRQPQDSWVRVEAPELRIVSEELWTAVQTRRAAIAEASAGRPERARRPKRLLSGLVVCGCCGRQMSVGGPRPPYVYYNCVARTAQRGRLPCAMMRRPAAAALEARVIEAMRASLLHPAMIEEAVREYHRLKHAEAKSASRGRAEAERELAEIDRRLARLVAQVEEGMPWTAIAARHAELSAQQAALQGRLEAMDAPRPITLHPAAAAKYRAAVEQLAAALDTPAASATEARGAARTLIRRVTVHPLPAHAQYELDIDFELSALLAPIRVGVNGKREPGRFPSTPTVPLRLRA